MSKNSRDNAPKRG